MRLVDGGCAARLHGRPPVSRINGPPTVGLRAQRRLPEAWAQWEAASQPPAGRGRQDWTTSPIYRSRNQGSEALPRCPAPLRTLLGSAGVRALSTMMMRGPHCWQAGSGQVGPECPELWKAGPRPAGHPGMSLRPLWACWPAPALLGLDPMRLRPTAGPQAALAQLELTLAGTPSTSAPTPQEPLVLVASALLPAAMSWVGTLAIPLCEDTGPVLAPEGAQVLTRTYN